MCSGILEENEDLIKRIFFDVCSTLPVFSGATLPICVMVGVTALCAILAVRFFRFE